MDTDQELVTKALADPEELRHLIHRYQGKLFRYIQRTLFVNKEDAEDILQDVFIKVYRNLNSYNATYKFSSWVYRITYNQCIIYLRKNSKHKQHLDLEVGEKVYEALAATDTEPETVALRVGEQELVTTTLEKLDAKYRTALVLKYLEEKDYSEISEIMQVPMGSVGSLINRAKKIFKKIITDERLKQ